MASCLARRRVLVFFLLVSLINTGNTGCYSAKQTFGATSRSPRRSAASARASIILQVLGHTGTSSIDPPARLRGGGPQDADGSALGTGMLGAYRLGKDDAGAAEEKAGSGDGLQRSGDWSQKPKKKRSRRRQQLLNMRKDKRPESQKPRGRPLGLHLGKDGADTSDHSELVEEERMLRDSFGLATAGGGVNNVRVGLKMTENNVGGDDDAMPGMTGKKDADRDEDRAVGLDPADRARISHTQSGRGGKREIELRTRPVEDLNSEDGEDRLSAAALRRKSHKLRRMRKRWGADLKGDDPRDVVARELKTALEEQEAEEQQRANVTIVRAENTFDWLSLGEGMAMFNRNQTVEKVQTRLELSSEGGRRPMGEFAMWGAGAGAGATSAVASCSKWGLRINKMQGGGDLWLGLLETPFQPAICKADRLATRAWMINDLGIIVRTGRAGREQLNGRASFKLPPPGAMAFRQGSIVVVTYRRHACTNSSALSELHLEVFQPGAKYEQQQAGGKPAVLARGAYSRGTPPANAGAGTQPRQCLLQNIPATARPFVNLVHKGDSVSIIPRDGLVRALRQLRRARHAAGSGELGASARGGSRKQALKEQERLLRQQILNDGFDPFGAKSGGQVAEGVDKELHRDSLFEDSSSAGSLVSDSLGADNDSSSGRALFGGRGASGRPGAKGETATPVGTNRVVDILTSAPIKKKWQQRGVLGAQTLSAPRASSEVSEGSQAGEVDDITEWNSDQVSSSFAGGATVSLPASAGDGEPSSDADTAADSSRGGWIRAGAPAPVVVKMDIDDDECVQGVPVVKVKSQKAQARAREAEEAQGQRA